MAFSGETGSPSRHENAPGYKGALVLIGQDQGWIRID